MIAVLLILLVLCQQNRVARMDQQAESILQTPNAYSGQEFLVCLPPSEIARGTCLIFAAVDAVVVDVEVVGPGDQPVKIKLKAGRHHTLNVSQWVSGINSGDYRGTIQVTASENIQVMIIWEDPRQYIRALPTKLAGSQYTIPQASNFILLVALREHTTVTFYKHKETPATVEQFVVTLSNYNFYSNHSKFIAGYQLIATHPVLVISGIHNNGANSGSAASKYSTAASLFPTSLWSTEYLCLGVKGKLNIMAFGPNVTVNITRCNTTTQHRGLQGRVLEISIFTNCMVHVESRAVLQVIHFSSHGTHERAAMFSVVPSDRFTSMYTFDTSFKDRNSPQSRNIHVIILSSEIRGLRLFMDTFKGLPTYNDVSTLGNYTHVSIVAENEGRVTIYHERNVPFVAYYTAIETKTVTWLQMGQGEAEHLWHGTPYGPVLRLDRLDNDCDNLTVQEHNITSVYKCRSAQISNPGEVSGGWSEWESLQCSKDCNPSEVRLRLRVCNNPAPSIGGSKCHGKNFELMGFCDEHNLCFLDCEAGKWGKHCANNCSSECYRGQCRARDGLCLGNCSAGYRGPQCQYRCPRGYYGYNCERQCILRCNTEICHPVTGKCPSTKIYGNFMIAVPVAFLVALCPAVMLFKFSRSQSKRAILRLLRERTMVLTHHERTLNKESITDLTADQLISAMHRDDFNPYGQLKSGMQRDLLDFPGI